MKIAILTLPLNINYGGILQAYALQTILEQRGHEVHIIEEVQRPLKLPIYKMPFSYSKRIIKNIIGKKCYILYEQKYNRELPIITENINRFINKNIHLAIYKDFSYIKESEYDVIIVGSDQVWRPKYFGTKQIEKAFLKFTKGWNIKRIAYAASFGTDEWEYTHKQTYKCNMLLNKFDMVSVRENSGIDLCEKYFNIKAQKVLDPTLLLSKEDYIKLFQSSNIQKSKGNLLCYILDETEEKRKLISQIANDKKLIPFNIKAKNNNIYTPLTDRIQPSIEQWIRGFYDAELVITDSFHACVFSILFKKPFIVYGNKNRGLTRFNSLLESMGLKNNLILNLNEYDNNRDYSISNECLKKLSDLRKESLEFLEYGIYGRN